METVETLEADKEELRNFLTMYEVSAAEERRSRDRLIASWQRDISRARDRVHDYLNQVGMGDPKYLHDTIHVLENVVGNMDEFLNRAGGRRK